MKPFGFDLWVFDVSFWFWLRWIAVLLCVGFDVCLLEVLFVFRRSCCFIGFVLILVCFGCSLFSCFAYDCFGLRAGLVCLWV